MASRSCFFVILAAAALLTTVDPWYRAIVHPRPWLGLAFCGFALFAGLNVALPLVGVPPAAAVLGSAALGALGLTPTFFERAGRWGPAARQARRWPCSPSARPGSPGPRCRPRR